MCEQQGCCLLNRSVKENLVMGLKIKPGDLQVHEACRVMFCSRRHANIPFDFCVLLQVAQIHEHIESLPGKYNTICGQRGSSFSGGQQQRLVIARALLREPTLLLLDEATSALDAETEEAVVCALDRWRRQTGATLLVITHRLRTVRGCDAAILLHQGKARAVIGRSLISEL